jgi:hypothetical protein
MDVEHEAGRSTADQRVKKVSGGGKALDGVAVRLDQTMERSQDRGIVVDDGNELCLVHRNTSPDNL